MDGSRHPVDTLRTPPVSIEAEQAVLGGLMIDNSAVAKIGDWLKEEDFYRRDHQLIYRGIFALTERNQPCDAVTLGEWFETQGIGEQVGGGNYILKLASTTPSAANVTAYAEIVREKSALRGIIDAGTNAANRAFSPGGVQSREIAADMASAMLELSGRTTPRGAKSAREIAKRWFHEIQRRYEDGGGLIGLATPWARLNTLTSGLSAGDLVVVAGRPGMGKSAWATNVLTCCALRGLRSMAFSLEMTDVSIFNRAIASIGNIPLAWLRQPKEQHSAGDEHWTSISTAMTSLVSAPMVIDDTAGLTASQIVARAKREHMRSPITGPVVIDHLHIVKRKGDNAVSEIAQDTAMFKALAKTLGVPVVLLAQLNRGLESRPNKRPVMSDLRESGAIEQDADIIVFLYRDDYYAAQENRGSEHPGMVEMILAKQREGEANQTVWARDRLAYGLLEDYDGDAPSRPLKEVRSSRGFRKPRPGMASPRDAAAGE